MKNSFICNNINWWHKVKVVNKAKMNNERQVIMCLHNSLIDGLLLAKNLPIKPIFLIDKSIIDDDFHKTYLSDIDYIAISKKEPIGLKNAIKAIKDGKTVVVFPEGKLSKHGYISRMSETAAVILYKTKPAIIPVYMEGTTNTPFADPENPEPKISRYPVTIHIGEEQFIDIDTSGKKGNRLKRVPYVHRLQEIMTEHAFWSFPVETLYSRLIRTMERYGKNKEILFDREHVENIGMKGMTYGDLVKTTFMLSHLIAKKTKDGENVGVLLPNLTILPAIIFGLNLRKRTPALINFTLGKQGIKNCCITGKMTTLVTSRELLKVMKIEDLPEFMPDTQFIYAEDFRSSITFADKMEVLRCLRKKEELRKVGNPHDTAVIVFTSGTESIPKGVALSHRALLANVDQSRITSDLTCDNKAFNALPIFHSFGLSISTLLPLFNGIPNILYPTPANFKGTAKIVYENNVTMMFSTNMFLYKYAEFAYDYDFRQLRSIHVGAEKLTDYVINTYFERFGIRIYEGYGSTECCPALFVNTYMYTKFGTVGKKYPGVEYKIKPVDGIEKGGELLVKCPNLMNGYIYHNDPGVVKLPTENGWFNIGDLIDVDEDGYATMLGRSKRFIKVAGEMVPLEVVENIAREADPSKQHAASSMIDGPLGEIAVLFTTSDKLSFEVLKETARGMGIGTIMAAKRVVKLEAIPFTGTGKVDYYKLSKMAAELPHTEITK